jgi:hypothetical protein
MLARVITVGVSYNESYDAGVCYYPLPPRSLLSSCRCVVVALVAGVEWGQ